MGTFGVGPLHNDTGLDFKDNLAMMSSPAKRLKFIASALAGLASCDPVEDSDAEHTLQEGLGACAVVADKIRNTYYYLREPDDAEDLSLDMIPEIDERMRDLAIQSTRKALGLARHPAMLAWPTVHDEQAYIDELGQLIRKLAR
ncbi:DUF4259 domain-containing protein [Streptomyces sp. 5-10]|uniref:DUF4259 domain-containing protein n=1 Tax=Streptomyces sp. 5-10 TaxID=878925 RepID=UPI00168A6825|nr:DUF4259 domain-containing protein [Streptomyces sp. 5-10]MBD3004801.1 DUF4259 domain-containing protein [Streptomyces sp. 5-10]